LKDDIVQKRKGERAAWLVVIIAIISALALLGDVLDIFNVVGMISNPPTQNPIYATFTAFSLELDRIEPTLRVLGQTYAPMTLAAQTSVAETAAAHTQTPISTP
jgi:hypothetical protein